ncbi:MAG TPA: sigma-70 family RNA polymerase sigma factor, partial [Planctomycetota bacterium]|nr:sigma-70 family RNA polymerase sigma factor [Planctomycetota bacterium]
MPAEVPDPLFLLQRSERVRALARRLLHGTDGAEDVAQEALLSSLGWRELSDEPLPARLAAQVRSLASRWRRGRARRARREAEVARPDRSEAVDELVERAAWQRTLVEAVLELEEPYRECILLRYFEGLPPRAIAEQQVVPVRTVHTRLARALTRLRARLERRVDLSAWVPLLAPLAAPPARPLAIPASSLGVLAVSPSKWILSLVAGAVVASTLLVLRGTGVFDAPRPLARPVESERPSLQVVASPETASHVLPVPVEVDVRASAEVPRIESEGALETPPDRELDLFGQVVDVYGQPLAGVALNALEPARASDREGCVQPRGSAVLAATTSDGEGRFRMRLERGQECTLEASLPGL